MLDHWLAHRLEDRKQKDLLRVLPPTHGNVLHDFTSNDYLGLSQSDRLYDVIRETLNTLPKRNGSTGSRLLSGNSSLAGELEEKLAVIFRSPAALLFNSGYTANLAILSSLPQRGDTILYDELAHASIKDGARLSLASKYSFRHNDLDNLEHKIKKASGRIFIAVESVYSMDGDECPLRDLVDLAGKYGCSIILDEAHSTGVRGPDGAGICVEQSLHDKVDVRIYTFGKAMGVCGACVTGSSNLVNFLINSARPFIYTTAPSPYTLAAIGCSFDFLASNIHLQHTLQNKINAFIDVTGSIANRTDSTSAIQTFLVGGNESTRQTARVLQAEGFDLRPILSPTVPEGSERIRICLHTYNSDESISALAQSLKAHAIEQ